MAQARTRFSGMAVHKETIAGAYVAQDPGAEGTSLGTLGPRQGALAPLVRQRQSKATQLVCVSEAGPGGAWLSRYLTPKGSDCWGVAPSLMPPKAGDRVTTARRARSGDLTAVSVPTVAEEALRDRRRAREATLRDLKAAKFRRNAVLLRPDLRSTGRAHWRPAPLRWLSAVGCPTPAHHIVVQEYVRAVTEHAQRRHRLDQALHAQGNAWRLPPVGEALEALRGVQGTGAVTPRAALGDRPRVAPPRALMTFWGLLPSASSPGARRRQGAIPNAGPTQNHPEPPLAGPRPAGPGRPKPARTRQPCHSGRRGHGSGVRGRHVGHCHPGPRATVSPHDGSRFHPQLSRFPTGMRRAAAPVLVPPSTAVRAPEGILGPRVRPAPDGGTEGGPHPTESRRSTRRVFLAPPLLRHEGHKHRRTT
jgi:transposase